MTSRFEAFKQSAHWYGGNATALESLYDQYLDDPESVPEDWRRAFAELLNGADDDARHRQVIEKFRVLGSLPPAALAGDNAVADHKQAGVLKLVNAYRVRGHQRAELDPLGLSPRPEVPDLELAAQDLEPADLDREFDTGSLFAPDRLTLREIIELCERVYCGSIGSEYMHITDTRQRRWLQKRLEGDKGVYQFSAERRRRILEKLTAAEGLERYLHTKYTGQKRFSLEGAEGLIPLLDGVIQHGGEIGLKEIVIGMAHRGRLNVLVNILGKTPSELFEEFEGKVNPQDEGRTGDVKYHLGYSSDVETPGGNVHLALAFNPSHLEIVDPVVVGSARARQIRRGDDDYEQVLPILIHGDAAIAGQGVVMELFNMSQARGFAVGGTFHIVVNNQIGFTTSHPLDARSTLYCTEVAKMVQAPIFHVNGDDPEALEFALRVASDFRKAFHKDVVIDLVCYRRHGHNEADEPSATQPMMYDAIRAMETVRAKYAETLVTEDVVEQGQPKQMLDQVRDRLDAGKPLADVLREPTASEFSVDWSPYVGHEWTEPVDTTAPLDDIRALNSRLTGAADDMELHSRVGKILQDRDKMAAGEKPLDWGFAETMAYATLIQQGHGLRLVGQDSGRGTFFHRHAVLHDQRDGRTRTPLSLLDPDLPISVIDSLLSEEAVLGFEYGYATADPERLVIWEAQFGDFVNGAQVVIDQFITSGEAKWGRLCGLVMFLPHGYEGQGPEHSSARLERFLQLSSNYNIQVCVPSTPSQMFHMLRRQMLRPYRKPLIVMTPKSLLRHKASVSQLEDLTDGHFRLVIEDQAQPSADAVRRVILCAGKVYYDLDQAREEHGVDDVAIIRVEQLYPFPRESVERALKPYAGVEQIIWCQEEPRNQGAWYPIRHNLEACIRDQQTLRYAGRPSSPSPAVGYYALHVQEQKALVADALSIDPEKLA